MSHRQVNWQVLCFGMQKCSKWINNKKKVLVWESQERPGSPCSGLLLFLNAPPSNKGLAQKQIHSQGHTAATLHNKLIPAQRITGGHVPYKTYKLKDLYTTALCTC